MKNMNKIDNLIFEFIQPSEFGDPYFNVINKNKIHGGYIFYHKKRKVWALKWFSESGLSENVLDEISAKLKELNKHKY